MLLDLLNSISYHNLQHHSVLHFCPINYLLSIVPSNFLPNCIYSITAPLFQLCSLVFVTNEAAGTFSEIVCFPASKTRSIFELFLHALDAKNVFHFPRFLLPILFTVFGASRFFVSTLVYRVFCLLFCGLGSPGSAPFL
jgi:hypothetical protein